MKVNMFERTIVLTKKEMTAASRYGSDAYKELQNARRDNPGFEVVTVTRTVKTQRETYKGLTYSGLQPGQHLPQQAIQGSSRSPRSDC